MEQKASDAAHYSLVNYVVSIFLTYEPRIGWLLHPGIRVIQFKVYSEFNFCSVLVMRSTHVVILFIRNDLNVTC